MFETLSSLPDELNFNKFLSVDELATAVAPCNVFCKFISIKFPYSFTERTVVELFTNRIGLTIISLPLTP